MNISDKKFIEFSEQVWERNKELLAEKRELEEKLYNKSGYIERLENELRTFKRGLKDIDYYKKLAFDRADEINNLKIEITNLNDILEEQNEYIEELEEENQDYALANDCLLEELESYQKKEVRFDPDLLFKPTGYTVHIYTNVDKKLEDY